MKSLRTVGTSKKNVFRTCEMGRSGSDVMEEGMPLYPLPCGQATQLQCVFPLIQQTLMISHVSCTFLCLFLNSETRFCSTV